MDFDRDMSQLQDFWHAHHNFSRNLWGLSSSFAHFRRGRSHVSSSHREMQSLEWVPLGVDHVIAAPQHVLGPFLSKVIFGCHPLKMWATAAVKSAPVTSGVVHAHAHAHMVQHAVHKTRDR